MGALVSVSETIYTQNKEKVRVLLYKERVIDSSGYSVQVLLTNENGYIEDRIPLYISRYRKGELVRAEAEYYGLVRVLRSFDPRHKGSSRKGELIKCLRARGYDARAEKSESGDIKKFTIYSSNGYYNTFAAEYIDGDVIEATENVIKYCGDINIEPILKTM